MAVTPEDAKPDKRGANHRPKNVPAKSLGVDKAGNVRGGQSDPKMGGGGSGGKLGGGGGKGI
jgi:hypothetical protein